MGHDVGVRALLAAIRCAKSEVDANLARHVQILADAASANCDLAVLPEMSLTGSVDPAAHPERLMRLDDPAISRLVRASEKAGVAICFGIAERTTGCRLHITQICAAAGRVTGLQRKRHLGEGEESFTAAAGTAVFQHAGVKFGIAICAEAGFDAPFDTAARPAPG